MYILYTLQKQTISQHVLSGCQIKTIKSSEKIIFTQNLARDVLHFVHTFSWLAVLLYKMAK